jgi:hypothetical protein
MDKISLNQFIQEKVLHRCYHDMGLVRQYDGSLPFLCRKCLKPEGYCINPNFSQPADWWELWEFCIKEEWFDDFLMKSGFFRLDNGSFVLMHLNWLRDREMFPEAIARYYGWEGEE